MEEKAPFFSVIVLAYQVEPFLAKCIDSILNQSFQDFEIILVNPPSDDHTDKICEHYAEKDGRIKVIQCKNHGQLINRVTGFSAANGRYLLCMDGDDWWKSFTLQEIFSALEKCVCDWIIFGYEKIKNGKSIGVELHTFPDMSLYEGEEKRKIFEKLIQGEKLNSIWTKVMSRDLFKRINENFNAFISIRKGEDLLYSLYAADVAEKILYLDKALYCYRLRDNSIMRSFSLNEVTDRTIIVQQIEKMMQKWNMTSKLYFDMLYKSTATFFIQVIFRCSTSAFTYKEKKNVYKQIKSNPLFQKTLPFQKKIKLSLKYRIFLYLFRINYFLPYICGDFYRLGRWMRFKSMKRGR